MVRVYTDGSYKPKTDQGGYASIITLDGELIKILQKGYRHTTNNRTELMGVLYALEYFDEPTEMEIYSDSSYVVNSINNDYLDKWINDNDVTKKNMDL